MAETRPENNKRSEACQELIKSMANHVLSGNLGNFRLSITELKSRRLEKLINEILKELYALEKEYLIKLRQADSIQTTDSSVSINSIQITIGDISRAIAIVEGKEPEISSGIAQIPNYNRFKEKAGIALTSLLLSFFISGSFFYKWQQDFDRKNYGELTSEQKLRLGRIKTENMTTEQLGDILFKIIGENENNVKGSLLEKVVNKEVVQETIVIEGENVLVIVGRILDQLKHDKKIIIIPVNEKEIWIILRKTSTTKPAPQPESKYLPYT